MAGTGGKTSGGVDAGPCTASRRAAPPPCCPLCGLRFPSSPRPADSSLQLGPASVLLLDPDHRLPSINARARDDGTDSAGQGWSPATTRGAPQTLAWVGELDRSYPPAETPCNPLLTGPCSAHISTTVRNSGRMRHQHLPFCVAPPCSFSCPSVRQPSLPPHPVVLSAGPGSRDREGSGKVLRRSGDSAVEDGPRPATPGGQGRGRFPVRGALPGYKQDQERAGVRDLKGWGTLQALPNLQILE